MWPHLKTLENMSTERIFQIGFWLLFGGLLIIQLYVVLRVRLAGESGDPGQKANDRKGVGHILVRIIASLALIGFLVLYAFNPGCLGVLSVPFPDWLRWSGLALGGAGFILYLWSLATLGNAWSPQLQTRENPHLVTGGPYARIRHPLYASYILFMTGNALLTANWVFVALLLVTVIVLVRRIPGEEQKLMETFGEEYRMYMQKTRGLIPK